MANFSFNIVEHLATLSSRGSWTLELNRVSWNGRPATYDLRKWSDGHEKMSKGISLTEAEFQSLKEYLVNG